MPEEFDVSVFVGCAVECISFTENTLHIAFDRDTAITVESSYLYHFGSRKQDVENCAIPANESRLMRLSGRSVLSADTPNKHTLRLNFGAGHMLEIFDDSKHYESFRIIIGDREIIV